MLSPEPGKDLFPKRFPTTLRPDNSIQPGIVSGSQGSPNGRSSAPLLAACGDQIDACARLHVLVQVNGSALRDGRTRTCSNLAC